MQDEDEVILICNRAYIWYRHFNFPQVDIIYVFDDLSLLYFIMQCAECTQQDSVLIFESHFTILCLDQMDDVSTYFIMQYLVSCFINYLLLNYLSSALAWIVLRIVDQVGQQKLQNTEIEQAFTYLLILNEKKNEFGPSVIIIIFQTVNDFPIMFSKLNPLSFKSFFTQSV